MKKIKINFVSFCALSLLIVTSSYSQEVLNLKTNVNRVALHAPVTLQIEFQPAGSSFCGLAIDWGDGKEPQRLRLGRESDSQSPATRQRSFDKPGSYTISVNGVFVSRGLNSAAACQGSFQPIVVTVYDPQNATNSGSEQQTETSQQASSDAGKNAESDKTKTVVTEKSPVTPTPPVSTGLRPEDFVVFFSRSSQYATVKRLDGSSSLAEPGRIQSNQTYCPLFLTTTFNSQQNELLLATLPSLLRNTFQRMGVTSRLNFEAKECIQTSSGSLFLSSSVPVVVIQRQALPQVSTARGFEQFTEVAVIPGATLASASQAIEQTRAKELADLASRATEFEELARRKSREKIASITLSYPKGSGNLRLCTRRGDDEFNLAAGGYFATRNLRLSKGYIDAAVAQNARIDRNNPFTTTYKDLEEFYVGIQRTPENCQVYVDYPENLKIILDALKRSSIEINPLVLVTEAKSDWAKQQGYADFDEYEFAKEIGGNSASVKRLAELGVTNRAAFLATSQRMDRQGYSKEARASIVIQFLEDEVAGAARKLSAVTVRSQREKEAEAAARKRAQEAAAEREAYAKRFPYYAVLSCGFGGSNINIIACFSGSGRSSVDTELKITQGTVGRTYKVYELASNAVGQIRNDGLHIDLPNSFSLTAQNASDSLTLTLRVYDRRTNRMIMQKQAGSRFEVVSARN